MKVFSEQELGAISDNNNYGLANVMPASWAITIDLLVEQARLANEMREALSRVEWTDDCMRRCWECGGIREGAGHAEDCPLGNALAKWRVRDAD